MHYHQRLLISFGLAFTLCLTTASNIYAAPLSDSVSPPVTQKIQYILNQVRPRLQDELVKKGLQLGAPVFIRIFKLSSALEVWVKNNTRYELFKTYSICNFSGYPGPKQYEGDWQSPEGFYTVEAGQLNPFSNYHLAFDIGYPNEYDRQHKRNGSNIMVHGSCSSMGCFAMSDFRMEEIYTIVHTALERGQEEIGIHIFPFRMSMENMQKFSSSPWINFWRDLKEGYDAFEQSGQVPIMKVANGRYRVKGTSRIALQGKRLPTLSPATLQNHQ